MLLKEIKNLDWPEGGSRAEYGRLTYVFGDNDPRKRAGKATKSFGLKMRALGLVEQNPPRKKDV
ncbi:hypothetical protein KKD37_04395 [Patescibacteria group bacterium]|nr:hypothetical protein [Patescibacteria group bacterium]